MDHWGTARTKLGAVHAIIGTKGATQKLDPEYDAQPPIQEPDRPPPSAALRQNLQPQGLNAFYYQAPAWSPAQPAANVPGHQYNGYAAPQNWQLPTQGYSTAQQLPQSPPPQHQYGDPQQHSSPLQSSGPYAAANMNAYQSNQYNTYAPQPYHDSPAEPQYSPPPQQYSSSPPQAPFSPPQRSTTDYYSHPQTPTPVQRSQTMPAQPCSHDYNQYWDEILGRCVACDPATGGRVRRLHSRP